jgi:hypothetical protein
MRTTFLVDEILSDRSFREIVRLDAKLSDFREYLEKRIKEVRNQDRRDAWDEGYDAGRVSYDDMSP